MAPAGRGQGQPANLPMTPNALTNPAAVSTAIAASAG
jgi:hypothetical protein